MPLDPQADTFLRQLARLNASTFHELTPEQITTVPQRRAEVASVEDRRVARPGGEIPIRLYEPVCTDSATEPTDRSALVYFHGGGWILGDLDSLTAWISRKTHQCRGTSCKTPDG